MPKLGENKYRMRKSRKEKIQDIRGFREIRVGHFFKVQCKMSSDASNHKLIKIDHKESIGCHNLKCFEVSWVH